MGIKNNLSDKNAVVIVAHPDDETLWCGGTILTHPTFNWFVISLCRGDDMERASRFYKSLKILKAKGTMGELDDGPEQIPLDKEEAKNAVLSLLPNQHFDLIITHNPSGEYTRHLRHEEVSRAVIELWYQKKVSGKELWTFAYEDGNKKYFPRAEKRAFQYPLSENIWKQKYALITETYGFSPGGFEAETTPKIEAFWKFFDPGEAYKWLEQAG
ncbi:PIG-L family deacetylase [Salegentibacter sp. JZCK2]|uniref:PIG-L deacetylase family protein n=1 Tax=Salegentibacter tibetensis TaxID=2873600 RepID=UPI001CCA6ED7|nr:PIG-L family deacetylase [Salegentibacter tibetensis]MBZ9728634.1 PIG-L family deacetylase [Salegentibacter tibetensis]